MISIFVLAAALMSSLSMAAYAQDYFTVTVKAGDTACSLCKENGLDYQASKNIIMTLNNMKKESELGNLIAGNTLKLPTSGAVSCSGISGDTIKFYVIPYVIQSGDSIANIYWLWGLRFENYQEYIKALNYKENLDLLFVGATYLLPTTEGNCQTNTYTMVMSHIMQSGDTVENICSAYGISYKNNKDTLERYNLGKDVTKLKAGEELLIPLI